MARALVPGTAVLVLSSCASSGATAGGTASEVEWAALATPRPAPLTDAPRVSFSGVDLVSPIPWGSPAPLPVDLVLTELVVAGLLHRRDVEFVERRRFTAADEAERTGRGRGTGAPAVGVSPGAELAAGAVWLDLVTGRWAVEVRLSSVQTGAVAGSHREVVQENADLVGIARMIVGSVLATLDELGRLPAWDDPTAVAASPEFRGSGIPPEAVALFARGLAAEEHWNWEAARRSYGAAAVHEGFVEARVALARTARLRSGGTLGES